MTTMAMQVKTMYVYDCRNKWVSVFDGNIVLLINCSVKLFWFFGLTNTNVVANSPKLTIQQYTKKKATTIFIAITSTLHSVRRITTSSNFVLNMILGWRSIRLTPAFFTSAIYSSFLHLHFPPHNFARIAFSTPFAFSVLPTGERNSARSRLKEAQKQCYIMILIKHLLCACVLVSDVFARVLDLHCRSIRILELSIITYVVSVGCY